MTGRSPRLPALIAAMLLLGAGAAARHPNSLSSSRWEIDGSTIRLVLRCQVVSVLEVVPALDADADQWIDEDELAAGREALRAYLAGHYRVRLDTGGDPGAGRPLPGRLVRLAREEDVAGFVPEQWIVTEWLFEDASPVRDLMLEMTLFFDTSPRHRDFAQIVWAGTEFPTQVLWMGAHRFHHAGVAPTIPAEPREDRAGAPAAGAAPDDARAPPIVVARPPAGAGLGDFVRLGVEHILTGWDHLAFLLALLVAARGVLSLLGVVTAFTLAHSLTLALAAFEVVVLPGRIVEVAIAASIVIAGLDGLLREPHTPWLAAFGFGLVHGLGFAGFLRETFMAAPSKLVALLGFNLGVELGQLAFVLVVTAAILVAFRGREREARLVPTPVAAVASLLVTLAGAWWVLERAVLA